MTNDNRSPVRLESEGKTRSEESERAAAVPALLARGPLTGSRSRSRTRLVREGPVVSEQEPLHCGERSAGDRAGFRARARVRARGCRAATSGDAVLMCRGRFLGMHRRSVNGSNGSGRKRAGAPRRRGVTKAQQDARRKIVASSGLEITPEEVAAVLNTLRR